MENSRICDKPQPVIVTRANVDALLDGGCLQAAMTGGRWWTIRRNGATRKWKRDARRIAIPHKMGMYGYGTITENDFDASGHLMTSFYRVNPDMVDHAHDVARRAAREAIARAGLTV